MNTKRRMNACEVLLWNGVDTFPPHATSSDSGGAKMASAGAPTLRHELLFRTEEFQLLVSITSCTAAECSRRAVWTVRFPGPHGSAALQRTVMSPGAFVVLHHYRAVGAQTMISAVRIFLLCWEFCAAVDQEALSVFLMMVKCESSFRVTGWTRTAARGQQPTEELDET